MIWSPSNPAVPCVASRTRPCQLFAYRILAAAASAYHSCHTPRLFQTTHEPCHTPNLIHSARVGIHTSTVLCLNRRAVRSVTMNEWPNSGTYTIDPNGMHAGAAHVPGRVCSPLAVMPRSQYAVTRYSLTSPHANTAATSADSNAAISHCPFQTDSHARTDTLAIQETRHARTMGIPTRHANRASVRGAVPGSDNQRGVPSHICDMA